MKRYRTLAILGLVALALSGCGGSEASPSSSHISVPPLKTADPYDRTDPRDGWVWIRSKVNESHPGGGTTRIWKICDGTTLLYLTEGGNNVDPITAVEGSSQCAPKPQ